MEFLEFSRANDLPGRIGLPSSGVSVSPATLVGTWHSTNRATRGIIRLVLSEANGIFTVRTFGAGESSEIDWGTVPSQAFAEDIAGTGGVAFRAYYDLVFLKALVAAYLNKRILVVDTYTTFNDNSARSNYFFRDHFYQ